MALAAVKRQPAPLPKTWTLAELQAMTMTELEQAYREAPCPADIQLTAGEPRGSVLAVKALDRGAARRVLRRVTDSSLFPWLGKNFSAESNQRGAGNNRINLLTLLQQNWYTFDTRFADSCIDGQSCILLDYNLPANPFFIRAIVDELREAGTGLLFGPAQVRLGKRHPYPLLYFAVSYR